MTYVMVDVEADGPIPGDYSMIAFGAVIVDNLYTYSARLKPISDKWNPDALSISGFSREETLRFDDPEFVMRDFAEWLEQNVDDPRFIADNNGFDWQFINWYFHHFYGHNPFGYSSTNLWSLYKGMMRNMRRNPKHLRKTRHTHNPVDDAMGNVEAFRYMITDMGLKI